MSRNKDMDPIQEERAAMRIESNTGRLNRKGRRWVFTLNNYLEEDVAKIKEMFESFGGKYMIIGREIAPTTGTPHLQGYMRYEKQIWTNTLMSKVKFSYLEIANGGDEVNSTYCRKQGDFEEYGEMKAKKKAEDKEKRTLEMLKDYKEMEQGEFEEKWPWESFHWMDKFNKWAMNHVQVIGTWDGNLQTKNYWIWGSSGTGKSKWAMSHCDPRRIYKKPCNKWWDGYNPLLHKFVIIEDIPKDASYLAYYVKIWADRYQFIAEVKGSGMSIDPGRFILIVTANYSIEEVFKGKDGSENDVEAIERRFCQIKITSNKDIFLTTKIDTVEVGLIE